MSPETYYELSNPQKRIWLTELLNSSPDMSNIGYLIEFTGKYDLQMLSRAVKEVVKTNNGLQLRFKYTDQDKGDLVQYLPQKYQEVDVEIIEAQSREELQERIEQIHRHVFKVEDDYHCSLAVFSINNQQFGFFEKAHHLVADGISATVVAREVLDTYNKMKSGEFQEIEKEHTYIDFLKAEKDYLAGEKCVKHKEYWLNRFGDYQGEEITFEQNTHKKNSFQVKRGSFQFPQELLANLETYKQEHRLSNFHLFMAALGIYFNRYYNHRDMVIGMPVHNRSGKVFRSMVGMFVSTLPFRITIEEDWTFDQLAAHVKNNLWADIRSQSYPFNLLVKDLKELKIDTDSLLNVQLIELPGADNPEIAKRAFYSTAYNISQLSIYLNQQNRKGLDELEVAIDYHIDIFQEREIAELFKCLTVILTQAVADPGKKLLELSFLEEDQYNHLVYELNDTAAPYPKDKNLVQLFQEQVTKHPENIALEQEGVTVSYSELDLITTNLAADLQSAGINPGALVGLLCERSLEAVTGIIGILKAGGAYLPIDPAYPLERKQYIIENSGITVMLVEKILKNQEKETLNLAAQVHIIPMEFKTLQTSTPAASFKAPAINPGDPAYVIYTSGTTGNPKGTLITHSNVVNYISWGSKHYVAGKEAAFPLYTSLSFDLTVTSIFIPLTTGNRMVIYRDSDDSLLIERVVRENKVNVIKLTPSHLKVIKELKCDTSRIRNFILGGEELKTLTARETDDYFNGHINIYNEYGPTETTVGCMIHRYDRKLDTGATVPIGKPADNVQIYILDSWQKPMPQGLVGEIYIAGDGVARGYLKNDALTSEKFLDNPFVPGTRMYKSGDLGRWNLDGILEFFGRCDQQVKIRGYRIEPGEIEKQINKLHAAKDAVVVVIEDKSGQKSLAAYMVARNSGDKQDLETGKIRKQLRESLPDYMIPAFFVVLDKIPLTNNGKVDKRALPDPRSLLKTHPDAMPATEIEKNFKQIWSDVLGIQGIGMEDNFFELGGDSIKAVQISSRMTNLELSVNPRDILEFQTINQIIANVDFHKEKKLYEQGTLSGNRAVTPIESWFFSHKFANPHYFNQSVLLDFNGSIDKNILSRCFKILITGHDGLRINLDRETGTLFYNNDHLVGNIKIQEFDIPSERNQAEEIKKICVKVKSSFDLSKSLLIKPAIISHGTGDNKLLITAHHLVIDGVSWRILLEDLYNVYSSLSRGEEPTLPAKTASLTDWTKHMEEYSKTENLAREIPYWQAIPQEVFFIPSLSEDHKKPGTVKEKKKISFTIDKDQTDILCTGSRKTFKSDVEVILITALCMAFAGTTGEKEVVMELENNGRIHEDIDLSRSVGWFTTLYPKLIKIDKEDLVGRIKSIKEQLAKTPEKGSGYGILKYLTGKIPDSTGAGLRFNYLGQFDKEVANDLFAMSALETGEDQAGENTLTASIEINCMILAGKLIFDLHYSGTMFNSGTMTRLLDEIKTALQEITSYFQTEDDVHFTPSDFDTVDLDEDDLAALFE